ncbi:MAG: amino acid adenylation domain-containing protein, partial [Cyanobacteria bacterium J06639_1]
YAALNAQANQVAHYLQKQGVKPEVIVGLCVPRSPAMIVGLLGILKAGGAYVPLDPTYPPARLQLVLADAQVSVLVTQPQLLETLPDHPAELVCLDEEWFATVDACPDVDAPSDDVRAAVTPEHLAYVIYTSGSTGRPKGVAMPHRALTNLLCWQQESAIAPASRTLQFTSLSFDVSFQEIFATLTAGGTLVLVSDRDRRDPFVLSNVLCEKAIERLFLPFSALQSLAEVIDSTGVVPSHLREAITAGEPLRISPAIARWFERMPQARLVNHYGPTESHVVTSFLLDASVSAWSSSPPIGTPIANSRVQILDRQLQPVPIGVAGELHIGGICLARGYLDRPDLTAERFIADPFEPDARLYRTGDLARYLPDGTIECLGRIDHQVKIRGFRIEPGEIEAVLGRHDRVRQCAVVVREDTPGDRRLVAYGVADSVVESRSLKLHLQQHLPNYMVPSAIVLLDSLPLTPSGKIDRKSLPAPQIQQDKTAIAPPKNHLECQLIRIWESALNVRPIGIEDNFFDLGGHSLLAVKILTAMDREAGVNLSINQLFEQPTIASISEAIAQQTLPDPAPCIVPLKPGNPEKPLFLIHAIGSSILFYEPLVARLQTDRVIYGIQSVFLKDPNSSVNTVTDLAECYVRQIEAVCPQGSLAIGGASFGGLVAYEVARQLAQRGRAIDALILFDRAVPGSCQPASVTRRYQRHFQKLVKQGPSYLLAKVKHRLTSESSRVRADFAKAQNALLKDLKQPGQKYLGEDIVNRQTQMGDAYIPSHYSGRVSLIRAAETQDDGRVYDEDLGWSKYARGGVRIQTNPGKHMSIFTLPHVETLATHVDAILQVELVRPELVQADRDRSHSAS